MYHIASMSYTRERYAVYLDWWGHNILLCVLVITIRMILCSYSTFSFVPLFVPQNNSGNNILNTLSVLPPPCSEYLQVIWNGVSLEGIFSFVSIKLKWGKLGKYGDIPISMFVLWPKFIFLKELCVKTLSHDVRYTFVFSTNSLSTMWRWNA